MAALIACDVHPLHNLRVLKELRGTFGADEAAIGAWIGRWIRDGFTALETMVARFGGEFAFGDTATLADCYIVPQAYSAARFDVDLSRFPNLSRACHNAESLSAFRLAHPNEQPDADRPGPT